MDNATRHFEFKDDKSSKFWEIAQAGDLVTVRYGKTGTSGQSQTKTFADDSAAAKHMEKLIAEKTGKGYLELGANPIPISNTDNTDLGQQTAAFKAKKTAATPSAKTAKPKNPLQDPEATPESLMVLLDKDDATNRQLAKHKMASAELLEKLSHSSDMAARKAVCLNPNASKDVLIRLAPQFPGDFFLNPAFDWLLLEDPDLLFKLGKGVLKNILKLPDCPLSFIKWAATPYDFGGFDRRFIHRKLYLEDVVGESVEVAICIDTSGSIGSAELGAFMAEIQGILDAYPQIRGTLFFADAALYGPYEFGKDAPMPKARGGGGTAFEPFFGWVAQQERGGTLPLSIYFTDGYGSFPRAPPESPVLWVVMPGGLESTGFPFGEVARMVSSLSTR